MNRTESAGPKLLIETKKSVILSGVRRVSDERSRRTPKVLAQPQTLALFKQISPRLPAILAALVLAFLQPISSAQTSNPIPEKPLPDIPTLIRQVFTNEQAGEANERNYIYREHTTNNDLDSHDKVTKTHTLDQEVFWLNGIPIERLLARDGRAISSDEAKEESRRIDNEVKKASKPTSRHSAGNYTLTANRLMELGVFSNERRMLINGSDILVLDFLGNPKVKTNNEYETMFREIVGTFWINEQDQALQSVELHFDHDFKVAGGLILNVVKGTHFNLAYRKINNEIWLPYLLDGYGHLRFLLLFGINGHTQIVFSNYRKFRATSTVLPGVTPLDSGPEPTPKPLPEPTPP